MTSIFEIRLYQNCEADSTQFRINNFKTGLDYFVTTKG